MATATEVVEYSWTIEDIRREIRGSSFVSPTFHQNGPDGLRAEWRLVLHPDQAAAPFQFPVGACSTPTHNRVDLELKDCNYTAVVCSFHINLIVETICVMSRPQVTGVFNVARGHMRKFAYTSKAQEIEANSAMRVPCIDAPRSEGAVIVHCKIYDAKIRGTPRPMNYPTSDMSSLEAHSWLMFEKQKLTDLTLVVGDKEFKLHKFVLAARSPVFSAMLEHDVIEATERKITIVDFEAEVVEEFIKYAYSGRCDLITRELLVFADKYDLEELKTECETELIRGVKTENAVVTLQTADALGASRLKAAALECIRKNAKAAMATDDWRTMTPALLNEVISGLVDSRL